MNWFEIEFDRSYISVFGCFSLLLQQIILSLCTVCSVQAIWCRSNSLWHPWGVHGILGVVMERTPSMLLDSCGSKAKKLLASIDRCHYSCFSLHALSAPPSSTWAYTTGGYMIYSACRYLFQGNINAVLTGFINIDGINPETHGVCYPLAVVHRVTVLALA